VNFCFFMFLDSLMMVLNFVIIQTITEFIVIVEENANPAQLMKDCKNLISVALKTAEIASLMRKVKSDAPVGAGNFSSKSLKSHYLRLLSLAIQSSRQNERNLKIETIICLQNNFKRFHMMYLLS
jgi:hypothetical protein